MAETILDVLRGEKNYSHEEAMVLDSMLMLHAEHGGGNNSTFTCRVLSSSGTDPYSAYAAAMGSLKGPKHGGANFKLGQMIDDVAAHVKDPTDDEEVVAYLERIARKEAFDGSGLLYGVGHAVYTLSDPRAEIIRSQAAQLAQNKGYTSRYQLIHAIERLGPQVVQKVRQTAKPLCANVDLYAGFVSDISPPRCTHPSSPSPASLAGWPIAWRSSMAPAASFDQPTSRWNPTPPTCP